MSRAVNVLRRSIAVFAGVAVAAATLTASGAPRQAIRVLQMNLCDSGIASCFSTRVVQRAAGVIRDERPDVVTLNEVCEQDVSVLGRTMGEVGSPGIVVWAFRAVPDRRTGSATHCVNGQAFGVGLVVRLRAESHAVTSGEYPEQDLSDPEIRVWLCISGSSDFIACTTHLANNRPAAEAQCRYLLNAVLGAGAQTVISGDFNLPQPPVPPGLRIAGDSAMQHVVVTDGFAIWSSRAIGMAGTTDHPALLVRLSAR
jgi:endonuclease/exonuclease/phosphatase family metal-dependent hydrolase